MFSQEEGIHPMSTDINHSEQFSYLINFIYAKPIQKCCVKVKSSFYILIKTFCCCCALPAWKSEDLTLLFTGTH